MSAFFSTLAISWASLLKSAESSDGAILIFMELTRRRLLDDRSLLLTADDDRNRVPGTHPRAAKRELSNDYAIADSGIALELDRRNDQAVRFEIRPHLIERPVDEVRHDVGRRRRSHADEQRDRCLRRHHCAFGRIG